MRTLRILLLVLVASSLAYGSQYDGGGGAGGGGGGSGYDTIQEEGVSVTQRSTLNFTGAGMTCAEDSGKTTCTLTAGANSYCGATGGEACTDEITAAMIRLSTATSCSDGIVTDANGDITGCASDSDTTYSAGDGLALGGTTFLTDSSSQNFVETLTDAAFNCGSSTEGAAAVMQGTNVWSYCGDESATPVQQYFAIGDSSGLVTDFTNATDLTSSGSLNPNSVSSTEINDGSIQTADIGNNQITDALIGAHQVDEDHIRFSFSSCFGIEVGGSGDPSGCVANGETGTGNLVLSSSPTIVTPTIASMTNAQHDHTNAAGGGTLGANTVAASQITNDTVGQDEIRLSNSLSCFGLETDASGDPTGCMATSETGTGANVLGTSPTIAAPNLTLETAADPSPTTAGEILYGTDEDNLYVGDGSATQRYFPGPHPLFGDGRSPGQIAGNTNADGDVEQGSNVTTCGLDYPNFPASCDPDLDCDSCTGTAPNCECTFDTEGAGLNSFFGAAQKEASYVGNFGDFELGSGATITMDNSGILTHADSINRSAYPAAANFIIRATGDITIDGTIDVAEQGATPGTNTGAGINANGIIGGGTFCAFNGTAGTGGGNGGAGEDCDHLSWSVGMPIPSLSGGPGGKGACSTGTTGMLNISNITFNGGGGGGGGGAACTGAGATCGNAGRGGAGVALVARGTLDVSGTIDTSGDSPPAGNPNGAGGGGSILLIYGTLSETTPTYTTTGGTGATGITNCGNGGDGGDGDVLKVQHKLG